MSDEVSRAVRKITGTSLPAALSLRHTSNPSRSGSITSSTIRSGRSASAWRSASFPLAAVATAQPWNFSATWTSSRMFGSSSTTSTWGIRSLSVITWGEGYGRRGRRPAGPPGGPHQGRSSAGRGGCGQQRLPAPRRPGPAGAGPVCRPFRTRIRGTASNGFQRREVSCRTPRARAPGWTGRAEPTAAGSRPAGRPWPRTPPGRPPRPARRWPARWRRSWSRSPGRRCC